MEEPETNELSHAITHPSASSIAGNESKNDLKEIRAQEPLVTVADKSKTRKPYTETLKVTRFRKIPR